VSVLVRLNESAHGDDAMTADRPFTWWHDVGAGQAWYTGLGHTAASHSDTLFTRLALGGIHVAVRAIPTSRPAPTTPTPAPPTSGANVTVSGCGEVLERHLFTPA
jgi:type 1 glutamine amidotransferase